MDAEPDPGSYGRVTNPERYAVLHDAAHRLLDRLTTLYLVEREDGGSGIDAEPAGAEPQEVVRLRPLESRCAPLTVAFSAFPGLAVRFGAWHVEYYPTCGCDACDEQPRDLVERLERRVADLTEGRFSEQIAGWINRWRGYRFGDAGWGRTRLQGRWRRGRHDWAPWPSR